MKAGWDEFWSDRDVKNSWSKKRIIKVLGRYIKPGMLVLDAGSGSGFFSRFFIGRGCRVFALDYSRQALDITREITENRAEKYIGADLLDSRLPDKLGVKFDIIFSDGLFEHFMRNEQNTIMNNFTRMKKKDGVIISFVPNKISFWRLMRPFLKLAVYEKPFSISELTDLHKCNNLKLVEYGGINVLPFRASPEFLGIKFGMLLYAVAQ